MKSKALRSISSILILATLLLAFASCAEKQNETPSETQAETIAEQQTAGETEESFDPGVGDYDFEGKDFTILVKGASTYNEWAETSIFTEKLEGDAVNDAIFERNSYLSETYGINIVQYDSSDPSGDVHKAATSDDYAYDVAMPSFDQCGTAAANGYLVNLFTLEKNDFSKAWWDQHSVEDLTIGGKLYFVSSDISTLNNDATWCTMFNKKMITDYSVPSPYDLVAQNKWTMENYYATYKGVANDLDGNGKLGPDDVFCNLTQDENYSAMYVGSGLGIISKDEEGLPQISLGTSEKCVAVLDDISQIMMDKNFSFNYHTSASSLGYHLWTTQMFEENRGLFWITNLQIVIRLRDMDTPMGIVPVPRFDEADERYYNCVWTVGSYVTIPTSNHELEMASVVLEAMAAKSRQVLRPAYFDIALNGKYLRDEESIEMLEMIIDQRVYELGIAYNFGSICGIITDVVKKGNGGAITEKMEAKTTSIQKAIDKVVNKFAENS